MIGDTMVGHNCVGGLLLREGEPLQILLGHRSPERSLFPDVWDFPGGHQESGETVEETLVRELREEIGVTPTAWHPRGLLTWPDAVEGGIIFHAFAVTAWNGSPTNLLPQEHTAIAWWSVDDACRLPLAEPEYVTWFQGIRVSELSTESSNRGFDCETDI